MENIPEETLTKSDFISELESLESDAIFLIMSQLYEDIRSRHPYFMKKWTKRKMIGWFERNYTFDIERQTWYRNSDI